MARLTLARKIAAITLTVWKKGVLVVTDNYGAKTATHQRLPGWT